MLCFEQITAPWWDDKPVAIVGGGHSLVGFDFDSLKEFYVVAVKATMFDLPWATAGIGLDAPRYMEWAARFKTLSFPVYWAAPANGGNKTVLMAGTEKADNVRFIQRVAGVNRLSDDPSFVYGGGTSSFAALGLTVLKRAKWIGLFGLDYNAGTDQNFHRNEQHYIKQRIQNGANWKLWASYYDNIKDQLDTLGVKVINGSPNSSITAFPRMNPDVAVACLSNLCRLGSKRDGGVYGSACESISPHDAEVSGSRAYP